MLEKEQGILALIYVTPLRLWEYMISKLLSLACLSLLVALTISLVSYQNPVNYGLLILGIFLTSFFYTLLGFLIATRTKSVNSFFMKMLPPMLLLILPTFLLIIKFDALYLSLIPSIASLKLILGAYMSLPILDLILCLIWMIILDILLLFKIKESFKDHMITGA